MTRARLKLLLASLMLVGGLTSVTVAGTYASFNSQESNRTSAASAGTLTLGDTVNSGTTCYSYGTGSTNNANSACSAVFTSSTLAYPSTTATTSQVVIKDNGSIGAGDLEVTMSSCTVQATSGDSSPGGGNPCNGGADIYIQETTSSGTFCWFPNDAAGACSLIADTLSDLAGGTLDLGSGPTAGGSRTFTIGMTLDPTDATNALQGEGALFSLTWQVRN